VSRRLVHTIAATLAATLIGTLAVPANAFASAPNPGFRTYPVVNFSDGGKGSVLQESFQVGDCIMTNSPVGIDRPDANGRTNLDWEYSMYTLHTNNFDQWHATFRFRDALGHEIFSYGPVDGNKMPHAGPQNGVSDDERYTNLFFGIRANNFRTFDQIATVEWQGEC
jgi:hypothetical protein